MSAPAWLRRFLVRGVFWRQFLHWATLNIPLWVDPAVIAWWSLFFLLWGPGRRGVMRNLTAIKPRSWALTNFFRTYRVFWNYAWTITDNARLQELRTPPDWDFVGYEHFEALHERPGGAIMLTAHMGSYDLGAHMFGERIARRLLMVRAPEADPQTARFEEKIHGRTVGEAVDVNFNTGAHELAIELLHAIRQGDIVAIQGDRATPGVASIEGRLFGKRISIPAGPFALAMAAHAPIHPVFVMRTATRHYALVALPPFTVERTGRDRGDALQAAASRWASQLESVIASSWFQWFTFEPFFDEAAQ